MNGYAGRILKVDLDSGSSRAEELPSGLAEEYLGDVIADVNARRGKVGGIETRGREQIISVLLPLAETFGYATDLRSLSQGRATHHMQFCHYAEVPQGIAADIIKRIRGE